MLKNIHTLFAAVILLTGCSKKADTVKDNTAPDVKLLSPVSNLVYKPGEKICVTATGLDDNTITTVTVKLMKQGQATPLTSYSQPCNQRSFQLDYKITAPAGMSSQCSVVVEARDYYGNIGKAGVGVSSE